MSSPQNHAAELPRVTIGMPVRNGAARLDETLAALTAQTHANFELIISDNASDDDTQAVCERWMRRDPRISYFRQEENIGPPRNFLFVLRKATSPYFMWAAHDDWWDPEFIAENLHALQTLPEAVCSVSIVEVVGGEGGMARIKAGADPLMGEPRDNVYRFLRAPGFCSRFYGLFRTEVLQECYSDRHTFWGFDWAVTARTLARGKHYQVPRVLMRRHGGGMTAEGSKWIPYFNRTWLGRRFPMLPLTCEILGDSQMPGRCRLLGPLLNWNMFYLREATRRIRRALFGGLAQLFKRRRHAAADLPASSPGAAG